MFAGGVNLCKLVEQPTQCCKRRFFQTLRRQLSNSLRNFNLITRNFAVTSRAALKQLFPEDDQKKIISHINEILVDEKNINSKKFIPKKIFHNYPENGPLQDINDLIEKYKVSAANAIKLCYAALKSKDQPVVQDDLLPKKKARLPRKVQGLKASISPEILNPMSITKFTTITLTEEAVSFVALECHEKNWMSQNLMDWNVLDMTNLPLTNCITNIWNSIPRDDVFVVHNRSSRGKSPLIQSRLYGALICALCIKSDFQGINENIFEVTGHSPPRHFNLFVGGEIVSPMNMISYALERGEESTPDDHVFQRSLRELNFVGNTPLKFNEFDDGMKESISQCLVVGKAFVEILKAFHEGKKKD